jgi:cell wall-associated NlpC family hydrolase
MSSLDPRSHAFRPDLADASLQGRLVATRFVAGTAWQITTPVASLYRRPAPDAMQVTQALYGETITVFEATDEWLWAQFDEDRYVGYLRRCDASPAVTPPTHRVQVPATFLYPRPDIKSQPATVIPLNARLAVTGREGAFLALADQRFAYASHLAPVDAPAAGDFVAIAEGFCGVPYYWGGKTVQGTDCSGLVQTALQACGRAAPRDTDMQENALGQPVPANDLDSLRRGDLVFWKGHVGIMTDAATLLHANGFHMQTVKEPLRQAVQRIGEGGSQITSIRRL